MAGYWLANWAAKFAGLGSRYPLDAPVRACL